MRLTNKLAILDLGTNTFNLLIAEHRSGSLTFTHREKIGVAFGAGSMHSKRISEAATLRAITAINKFKNTALAMGCSEVRSFSTAVLRNADNCYDVVLEIEKVTGLKIEVISGQKEAQWIANAALHELDFHDEALILDIGGGSVEMIVVHRQAIRKLESFPLGVTKLLEMKNWSDPLRTEDIQALNARFVSVCGDFLKELKTNTLIGTAGVFETLVAYTHLNSDEFKTPVILNCHDLIQVLKTWQEKSCEQRDAWHDILPVRRKTLHIAATLLLWLMDKLSIQNVVSTPNSMAEGAALEILFDL